jgi:rSAM/selenodomain-associated transferase 1
MRLDLLIIFYRNPEPGRVKTRLAATVGDERALAIYLKLASHTRSIAAEVDCDRIVWYSNFADTEDNWSNQEFKKEVQYGEDLGSKMQLAFEHAFSQGYSRVCIIGTDCLELTTEIINEAFYKLKNHDAVLGPALDGGYYLLGMKKVHPEFFTNNLWSTDSVSAKTIEDFTKLNLSYHLLPTLRDVDTADDLPLALR